MSLNFQGLRTFEKSSICVQICVRSFNYCISIFLYLAFLKFSWRHANREQILKFLVLWKVFHFYLIRFVAGSADQSMWKTCQKSASRLQGLSWWRNITPYGKKRVLWVKGLTGKELDISGSMEERVTASCFWRLVP